MLMENDHSKRLCLLYEGSSVVKAWSKCLGRLAYLVRIGK